MTNLEIHGRVARHIGKYETLLLDVVQGEIRWFEHGDESNRQSPCCWEKLMGKDHEEGLLESDWTLEWLTLIEMSKKIEEHFAILS